MGWIREVIVDLIVNLVIVAAIWIDNDWFYGLILGYTLIMVLAKAAILFSDASQQLLSKAKSSAPDWFYRLSYLANMLILLYLGWWYAAAGWILIWIISEWSQQKMRSQGR